jgi:hypothetical protein
MHRVSHRKRLRRAAKWTSVSPWLAAVIYGALGHMIAFVPLKQYVESRHHNNVMPVVVLTFYAGLNFARRQGQSYAYCSSRHPPHVNPRPLSHALVTCLCVNMTAYDVAIIILLSLRRETSSYCAW